MHYCKTTININMNKKNLEGVENLAVLVFSYCSSNFFPYIPTNFLIINMTYVSAQGAQVPSPLHLIRFLRLNLCVPAIMDTRCKRGKEMLGNANKTEQWETGAGVCLLGVGGKQLVVTGLGIIVSCSVLTTQSTSLKYNNALIQYR